LVENHQFEIEPTHLYLAPQLGVNTSEFRKDIWRQKTSLWAIVWHWRHVRDPAFSPFVTVLACDRQTDRNRQTDRHTTTAYTAQR